MRPRSFARSADIRIVAAAPSDIWLELPAVTDPSAANAGRSLASALASVSRRGPSSVSKAWPFTGTGTISSLKRPPSMAATARWCERRAKASAFSRSMPYFRATSSAVMPIPR